MTWLFKSNRNIELFLILGIATLQGCASNGSARPDKIEKQVIDNGVGNGTPAWVQDTKTSWLESGGIHKFKSFHSIKGDERLTACYELARLNSLEQITSEMWADFKVAVSHSTQSISEATEDTFIQSRNLETRSNVRGLRFTEAYHQRYLVNGIERIDCFVLGELADADYRQMRTHLLSPVIQANPELRKAITEKHIDLFRKNDSGTETKNDREPSPTSSAASSVASAKVADPKK